MDCPYGEKMCGDTYGCYCQRCWDERTKPAAMQTCGYCGDTSAWQRVHDRLNVLGDFAGADKVREMVSRGIKCPMED